MTRRYLIIFGVTLIVAAGGSLASIYGMDWYKTLRLPGWTPDGSIFGGVWTILYGMAAASAVLFFSDEEQPEDLKKPAAFLFLLNALANLMWPVLFFALHKTCLAVADCVLVAATAAALAAVLWRTAKPSALLLVPYAAWSAFAVALNSAVCLLNR